MYNVGIIGCGAIFNRHVLSIKENKNFKLVSICDIDKNLVEDLSKNLNVKAYTDYKEMAKDKDVNFIVIASPNYYHYEQSIFCLKNKCDVLIEKPVSFKSIDIDDISRTAKEYNQKAFCVLQVRLNNSVAIVKETLSKNRG